MELACRYLARPQRGIEIGASALNPFPSLDKWNLDYPGGGVFQAAQHRISGTAAEIDVFGVGDALPFGDGSLDYVLTSHVLEHMPDVIRCLREWSRVVKDDGTVFTIVPHRKRTFDADRPRTELEHLLADYAVGMTIDANPMVPTSHYHVWETEDIVSLIEVLNHYGYLDWQICSVEDVDSKAGNGFTIVSKKRSHPPLPVAPESAPVTFHLLTLDLPFQVAMRTTEHIVIGQDLVLPELPRGRYRVLPVHGAFPPRAGVQFSVDVGIPVGKPQIESVERRGDRLHFCGSRLTSTTYLKADFGDGVARQTLPLFIDDQLVLDISGLPLPDVPFKVVATNLPPGGQQGDAFELRAHLE